MPRRTEQPYLPFDAPAEPQPAPSTSPATATLVAELARACEASPLEEKVLVAPSLFAGHTLVERLAREGHSWIHLRVETVRTLALGVVGPELAREGLRVLSRAQALALVEQACAEALRPGAYFGALRERPGLHRALQRTLEELRAAGIGPRGIPAAAFTDRRKPRELRAILERYVAALASGKHIDSLDVVRRALEHEPPASRAALYLLPADMELSELERRFLERLAGPRLRVLPVDDPAAWTAIAARASLIRCVGEENEIREVFRRVLSEGVRFDDVEVLHTDDAVYPALVWELAREHGIPCTFAGGVAVTYSRPGQAALAFLSWIAGGFASDRLRSALASGSLSLQSLDAEAEGPGARAVARAIRRARIGWGRYRHAAALDRLVRELEAPERPSRRDDVDLSETAAPERSAIRARLLAAARRAKVFTTRALELAPAEDGDDALRALARGARAFVSEFGRVADDLDGAARTALDTLFREIAELPAASVRLDQAVERLQDAVGELAVMPDRPRPGRIHVSHFEKGGHSGRRNTFLVGLDDTRHPGRDLEDPVLLDDERRRINEALEKPLLALERERPREQARALRACVARLRGTLTASYSKFDIRNLSQAGEPGPSPFFLELYRASTGRPDADYRSMLDNLEEARGFVPSADSALDEPEWWLARLEADGPRSAGAAAPLVRSAYPWLEDGRIAVAAREADDFSVWDGRLREPAPELDPRRTGRPISASRIQSLASCPFAYFVRDVLRVEPPDDLVRDPTRWLEPRDEGSLLHEVFRLFLERITAKGEKPHPERHLSVILAIAEERIVAWRDRVPPSSLVAFEAQRDAILEACRTFLRSEAEHCRDGVTPKWFEVSFGRKEAAGTDGPGSVDPVEIALPGGQRILLRGSIDRVDEAADGSFHVWDYKTGSAAGIQEGRGLHGGRQAQPALYAMALEALLGRSGRPARVSRSGYFFPGRKGEGQRMTVPVDATETGRALSQLFDLAGAGFFPHATAKEGCKFCDFESVCGGPAEASASSKRKLSTAADPALAAFRQLHGESDD